MTIRLSGHPFVQVVYQAASWRPTRPPARWLAFAVLVTLTMITPSPVVTHSNDSDLVAVRKIGLSVGLSFILGLSVGPFVRCSDRPRKFSVPDSLSPDVQSVCAISLSNVMKLPFMPWYELTGEIVVQSLGRSVGRVIGRQIHSSVFMDAKHADTFKSLHPNRVVFVISFANVQKGPGFVLVNGPYFPTIRSLKPKS